MLDGVIFGGELVGAVVCAGIFALAVTGREGFNAWETDNLNRAAILSGIGAVVACALLIWRFI